jgi:hypothetical protein
MPTDPAFAEWLQSESRAVVALDAAARAKWGDLALAIDAQTALHSEAGALGEATRRLTFGNASLVEESITIARIIDIAALRGACHSFSISKDPDYEGGVTAFVLGGYVDHATGITNLNVLRQL